MTRAALECGINVAATINQITGVDANKTEIVAVGLCGIALQVGRVVARRMNSNSVSARAARDDLGQTDKCAMKAHRPQARRSPIRAPN